MHLSLHKISLLTFLSIRFVSDTFEFRETCLSKD